MLHRRLGFEKVKEKRKEKEKRGLCCRKGLEELKVKAASKGLEKFKIKEKKPKPRKREDS